jgi:hypothetical protein
MDSDFLNFVGVMITLSSIGLGGYFAVRLINILLTRVEARGGRAPAELDELRGRIEELEADRVRMLELEERVDFTERVLAREGAPPVQLLAGEERQ